MPYQEATAQLQELIHRQRQVTTVLLHPPSASLARVMEAAGAEAGLVGTSAVVGSYTGMEDVGTATLNECVQIAGWIARSVRFPVILESFSIRRGSGGRGRHRGGDGAVRDGGAGGRGSDVTVAPARVVGQ